MKETATPEEWAACMDLIPQTLNSIAKPTDRKLQEQAIIKLYEESNNKPPARIYYADGPLEMYVAHNLMQHLYKKGDKNDYSLDTIKEVVKEIISKQPVKYPALVAEYEQSEEKGKIPLILSTWWQKSCLGWFRGGEILGVKYDPEKYATYTLIVENIDMMITLEIICFVSAHPTKCEWSNTGLGIHCDDGPAVEWADGYKLWAIEGILVPKTVVMEPHLQTLAEINAEENSEVKRIRINRFGWTRYIEEAKGKILDTVLSGSAWETLVECDGFKVLCTYDPSTGRPYALEVGEECNTCAEAQRYLLGADAIAAGLGLDTKAIETYPAVRT